MLRILLLLLTLTAIPSQASADFIYLALGDSSAFGETDRTRNPSNGDRGYVSPFADSLAQRNGGIRPTVVNLAINGETSRSYFTGTGRVSSDGQGFNTNYTGLTVPYPQSVRLNDLFSNPTVAANVKAVSVTLGANNLDGAASDPNFLLLSPSQQQAVIAATLANVQLDYISTLTDLRSRFPSADLYVMGYHNPYNGAPELPISAVADPAVRGLNQVIAGVGSAFGATYVDIYGAIHPNEATLSLIRTYPTDPINFVHLNDAGYAAAGNKIVTTAGLHPVPAPAGVVLLAVGALTVYIRRRIVANR
jgi:lysophospholipase L1-like esterase